MSLFVPHVFATITKEKVASIFSRFGEISSIDLVNKKTNDKAHNVAYIRFENWHETEENISFQNRLTSGDMKAHVTYDDKWFWIVLENKRMKPKVMTPKKILKRVVIPNAPIKKINTSVTQFSISHIARDLFGEDNENCDLVDATYVYHMENEVRRLTELNWQLSHALMLSK